MSEALEARAEAAKLARTLGTDLADLSFLHGAASADIRQFREQVTDALFDGDRERLGRLAAGSKLLPGQVAATIARRALGPLLCARIAGLVEPAKAIDTAKHLPPSFLAAVSVEIDPRRAKEVIAQVPPALVGDVAGELAGRGELVAMGRFVGYVGDGAVRAAMDRIDDASLLRIAFTMEGKDRLDHMIGLVDHDRLAGVLTAADRENLWPEALDLLEHVGDGRKAAIAEHAAAQEGLLERLTQVAADQDLWDVLLPVVAHLPPPARDRVAALAATLDEAVLEHVIEVVCKCDLWSVFVPLAAQHMDAAGRERVAAVVAGVDDCVIYSLADAVERDELWVPLLTIAETMTPDQLSRIADRLLAAGLEKRFPALLDAVDSTGLWDPGLALLAGLDPDLKQHLVEPVKTLGPDERARVAQHARDLGLLEQLGPIGAALDSGAAA